MHTARTNFTKANQLQPKNKYKKSSLPAFLPSSQTATRRQEQIQSLGADRKNHCLVAMLSKWIPGMLQKGNLQPRLHQKVEQRPLRARRPATHSPRDFVQQADEDIQAGEAGELAALLQHFHAAALPLEENCKKG